MDLDMASGAKDRNGNQAVALVETAFFETLSGVHPFMKRGHKDGKHELRHSQHRFLTAGARTRTVLRCTIGISSPRLWLTVQLLYGPGMYVGDIMASGRR